jgi:hypothetical protein
MRTLHWVVIIALCSSQAFAQSGGADSSSLATRAGHELNFSFGSYKYVEPGTTSISIHGPKYGGEYTGTLSLGPNRRWFAKANVRGTMGNTTYDGWCYPFLIVPDNSSPNGYALDLGDASPCSETGNKDWYLETRGLFGKDFIGQSWAVSPETGLGYRHLSNGIPDIPGYRTDDYLYLPLGVTTRTRVASHHTLSLNFEYDLFLHGWQTTRDSQLGGGDVPATPTTPPFTINGFSDISFHQHSGWGIRAGAKYQLTRLVSVEPAYIHWNVSASPVSFETATYTVNGITAHEQFGAIEPLNHTDEFAIKLAFHF